MICSKPTLSDLTFVESTRMRFNIEEEKTRALASRILILLLDVDGVLTDGKLIFSNSGEEAKAFSSLDGHGIKMLLRAGLKVGIITGRTSRIVEDRCRDLGITLVLQGQEDKAAALKSILCEQNIDLEQVAYVGDDLPDWPVLKQVGLSFSVSSGHPVITNRVAAIAEWPAGGGAVREICDFLLTARGSGTDYFA